MEVINYLIILIPLAWLITEVNNIIDKLNECLKGYKKAIRVVLSVFTCLKCCSFWVTYIYTNDLIIAAQVSFIANIVDRYLLTSNVRL